MMPERDNGWEIFISRTTVSRLTTTTTRTPKRKKRRRRRTDLGELSNRAVVLMGERESQKKHFSFLSFNGYAIPIYIYIIVLLYKCAVSHSSLFIRSGTLS